MKVIVIYNSKSGGAYTIRRIKSLFRKQNVSVEYSFSVDQLGSQKLAKLIQKGAIIAVVGGDGTIGSVAKLVMKTRSTLLPLPGGTFNHFVRDLGGAPTVESAIAGCKKMEPKLVDMASVNGEYFLNNSNIGLYPFSLIERKKLSKVVGKWAAAFVSAVDQLSRFRRHKLVIDGKQITSPFVFVGNNYYDIARSVVPQRTRLDKGVLTVMLASSSTRRSLIGAVVSVMKGSVSHRNDFSVKKRKTFTVYSHRKSIPISMDGEVRRMELPLIYKIEPQCLKVLVPKVQ